MFSPRFQLGGYAVSYQGFKKIIKRTDAMVDVDKVETLLSPRVIGKPCFCTPGKSEGFGIEKTKILQDEQGEYLQWGRAKHCPKWRPWNGEPIYYSVMSPDYWPR
jgi:hypothetical protein